MREPTGTEAILPSEQKRVRDRCHHPSNTFVEFRKEEVEQSVNSRFEKQVKLFPDRLAIKSRHQQLTYSALNELSNNVAYAILARLGPGQEPVALLFETDAMAIAAMLGTLKAGKFFVGLEPSLPTARLKYMVEDAGTGLILTNNRHFALAGELAGDRCRVVDLDSVICNSSSDSLEPAHSPDAIAYLVYTSGSTGRPKGVVHTHRTLLHNSMCHINYLRICHNDHLTLLHSYGSSAAYPDIFGALLSGATVYPYDFREDGLAGLGSWLLQEEITVFNWVVTPFRHFVEILGESLNFPSIRIVMLGSEPIAASDMGLYRGHFSPDCVFVARFGTSEAIIFRYFFFDGKSRIGGRFVPAGYAVPDKEVVLIDDAWNEVGIDCIGEIAVRSSYLALGYWHAPELTQAAFRPDPAVEDSRLYRTGDLGILRTDGCLEFVGRKDFQVKIRGYRVELAEIEVVLRELDEVKEAAVVAREYKNGEKRLTAYFVPAVEPRPTARELRKTLSQILPDYMIPSAFVPMGILPLTPAGKIDRESLREPDWLKLVPEDSFETPRFPLEETLAGIWAQILDIERVGIHDNFFELGGNSLLTAQLVAQVNRACGVQLSLSDFFQAPTVARLAATVERIQDSTPDTVGGRTEEDELEVALRLLGRF
jgi:amino acid adenylation domain-containing protein